MGMTTSGNRIFFQSKEKFLIGSGVHAQQCRYANDLELQWNTSQINFMVEKSHLNKAFILKKYMG